MLLFVPNVSAVFILMLPIFGQSHISTHKRVQAQWLNSHFSGGPEFSVVTTSELSPPPRWLATTKPTPPSRCFTVFSAVFLEILGAVS